MSYFDPVILARAQFAFTMSFHIVFPAFSIGLASFLMVLEARWLWTGNDVYLNLFKYWLKIFAVAFGMGVVSGVVMSYQFGTNWSVYADKTGPILGPLMAYEVLSAFFLEAGFLGVMLFGMGRVGKPLHFAATLLVALGTLFSATWILVVNSWMQTPRGYSINEAGQFVPENWLEIIFNPSFRFASSIWSSRPISRRRSSSAQWPLGTCCTAVRKRKRAPCSPWRCGWPPSSPRSRSWPATHMA